MNLYPYPEQCPHLTAPQKFDVLKHGRNLTLAERIMYGAITVDDASLKVQLILNQSFASLENKRIDDIRLFIENALHQRGIKFSSIGISENPRDPLEICFPTQMTSSSGEPIFFKVTPFNPAFLSELGTPLRFGGGERRFPESEVINDEFKSIVGWSLASIALGGREVEKIKERLFDSLKLSKSACVPEFQDAILDEIITCAQRKAKELVDVVFDARQKKIIKRGVLQVIKGSEIQGLNDDKQTLHKLIEKSKDVYDGISSLRKLKETYNTLIEVCADVALGNDKDSLRVSQVKSPFEKELQYIEEAICYLNPQLPEVNVSDDNRYTNYARYFQVKTFLFESSKFFASNNSDFVRVFGNEYKIAEDELTEHTISTRKRSIEHAVDVFTIKLKPLPLEEEKFREVPISEDLAPHAYGFAFYSHRLHKFIKNVVEKNIRLSEEDEFEFGRIISNLTNHLDLLMSSPETGSSVFSPSTHRYLDGIRQDLVRVASSTGLNSLDLRTLGLIKKTLDSVIKFVGESSFTSEQDLQCYLVFALGDCIDPISLESGGSFRQPHHLEIDKNLFKKQILLESDIVQYFLSKGKVSFADTFVRRALSYGVKENPEIYTLCCLILKQAEKGFFASQDEQRSVFGRVDGNGNIILLNDHKAEVARLKTFFDSAIKDNEEKESIKVVPKRRENSINDGKPLKLTRKKRNRLEREHKIPNENPVAPQAESAPQPEEVTLHPVEEIPSGLSIKEVLEKLNFPPQEIEAFLSENENFQNVFPPIDEAQLELAKPILERVLSLRDITLLLPKIPDLLLLISQGSISRENLFDLKRHRELILTESLEVPSQDDRAAGEDRSETKKRASSPFESRWSQLKKEKVPIVVRIASLNNRAGFVSVVQSLRSIGMEMNDIYSVLDRNPSLLAPEFKGRVFSDYFENDFLYAMYELGFVENKEICDFIIKHPRCFHPDIASHADEIKRLYTESNLSGSVKKAVTQYKEMVNKLPVTLTEKIEATTELLFRYDVVFDATCACDKATLKSKLLEIFPIILKFVSDDASRSEEILCILRDFCQRHEQSGPLKIDLHSVAKASFVNPYVLRAALLKAERGESVYRCSELVDAALTLQKTILERNPQFKMVRFYVGSLQELGQSDEEIVEIFSRVEVGEQSGCYMRSAGS